MNQRHSTETTPKHLAASAEKCNIIEWRILGYSVNIYLSIYPSIHLSIISYPILSYPIYVSMYLCIYVSMYVCMHLSIYLCTLCTLYLYQRCIWIPMSCHGGHGEIWVVSRLAFCAVLLHQEAATFRDSSLLRFLGEVTGRMLTVMGTWWLTIMIIIMVNHWEIYHSNINKSWWLTINMVINNGVLY